MDRQPSSPKRRLKPYLRHSSALMGLMHKSQRNHASLRRHSCALRSEIAAARNGISQPDRKDGWRHSTLCPGRDAEWLDSASRQNGYQCSSTEKLRSARTGARVRPRLPFVGSPFEGRCSCRRLPMRHRASAMLASTYRIDEQPTTSAVVLSNIAGVFSMAMWIYVAEKIWT